MRVFVTGAGGWIGRALVVDLIQNGHEVIALARSDESADIVSKLGAKPHRGDSKDLESLKRGAAASDGVIHLAYNHDFRDLAAAAAEDRDAIEAMAEVMAGSGNPLVIAGGTLALIGNPLADENSEPERVSEFSVRELAADTVKKLSKEKGIRGSIVRLSPTVHGNGDKGLIPMMINMARTAGFAPYVGDGSQQWSAVSRDDAAVLFRLALEKGTPGATYNGVAEQGVPIKEIATVIGKHLQIPVESKTVAELAPTFGFFAYIISDNHATSSEKTKQELGWQPVRQGLLADMEAYYFSPAAK